MNEEEIRFCPVCGSKKVDKQLIKSRDPKSSIAVDYCCSECGSNGDIDICIQRKGNSRQSIKGEKIWKERWTKLKRWLKETIRLGSVGDPSFRKSEFYEALENILEKIEGLESE